MPSKAVGEVGEDAGRAGDEGVGAVDLDGRPQLLDQRQQIVAEVGLERQEGLDGLAVLGRDGR